MIIVCVDSKKMVGPIHNVDYTFEIHHCKGIVKDFQYLTMKGKNYEMADIFLLSKITKFGGWGHKCITWS